MTRDTSTRSSRAALAGAAGAVAALTAGLAAVVRRWGQAADPTGGPLREPDGRDWHLERPDGVRLAVREIGEGGSPTFVLPHCWTGDRRVWGPVAQRLADAGAHVVLYDHRAHGRSTLDAGDVSLEALGDDLAALLEALPAERVIVAGHSMGGMTAQACLLRHPELVARKVAALGLVATACDGQNPGRLLADFNVWLMRARVTGIALRVPWLAPLLVRFTVGRGACMPHLRAVAETYLATPPAARAGFLRAMYAMNFAEALRVVRVPTVILSGTRDLLTLPPRSRRMAELMPHAKLVSLPDAGHMLPWEEPGRVAAVLLELAAEAAGAPEAAGAAGVPEAAQVPAAPEPGDLRPLEQIS